MSCGDCKEMKLTQMPRISVSMNRKINLGNYESEDIFVSLACDSNYEGRNEVDNLIKEVEEILDKKVKERISQLDRSK